MSDQSDQIAPVDPPVDPPAVRSALSGVEWLLRAAGGCGSWTLRCGVSGVGSALRLRSDCAESALRLRCVCVASALRLRTDCAESALRLRCVCFVSALRLLCVCFASALRLRCDRHPDPPLPPTLVNLGASGGRLENTTKIDILPKPCKNSVLANFQD